MDHGPKKEDVGRSLAPSRVRRMLMDPTRVSHLSELPTDSLHIPGLSFDLLALHLQHVGSIPRARRARAGFGRGECLPLRCARAPLSRPVCSVRPRSGRVWRHARACPVDLLSGRPGSRMRRRSSGCGWSGAARGSSLLRRRPRSSPAQWFGSSGSTWKFMLLAKTLEYGGTPHPRCKR
jgi:hypothetical protein